MRKNYNINLQRIVVAASLALLVFILMLMLIGCEDDEGDVDSGVTQNYEMMGTWYAEKRWSIPTQFD